MDLLTTLGLSRQSQEDAIQFAIYPQLPQGLESLREQCLELLNPYLKGYIWQKDAFVLCNGELHLPPWVHKAPGSRLAEPPCLWGTLRYGDNVEDEWFVVSLLYELTRQLDGISARVWDDDGEFLLIEAAYVLPRWLKPETSRNRIWIHRGQLHIIPLPSKTAGGPLSAYPSVQEALDILSCGRAGTLNLRVDAAIRARIRGYPEGALGQMQWAKCRVPLKVAQVLREEPQLVANAVEAFYYRDPDDMKLAARMHHFPLTSSDLVNYRVCFNRCMYAQLMQQSFYPPRGVSMPLPSDPEYKAADLGVKVTAGMEIVYCKSNRYEGATGYNEDEGDQERVLAEEPSTSRLRFNPAWLSYEASLQKSGYFQENIPGSKKYKELWEAAARSFMSSDLYHTSLEVLREPGVIIGGIMSKAVAREEFEEVVDLPDSDDSWLRRGAEQLDRELQRRQQEMDEYSQRKGRRDESSADCGDEDRRNVGEVDAHEVAEKFQGFVNFLSSFEGAEVPGDPDSIHCDPKKFFKELEQVLGVDAGRTHEGPGDMDDWDASSSDEGSSFYGETSSGNNSEDEDDNCRAGASWVQDGAGIVGQGSGNDGPSSSSRGNEELKLKGGAGEVIWGRRTMNSVAGGVARGDQVSASSLEQGAWEVCTETDSDDYEEVAALGACTDEPAALSGSLPIGRGQKGRQGHSTVGTGLGQNDVDFYDAYSEVLDRELSLTHMKESFERVKLQTATPGRSVNNQAHEDSAERPGSDDGRQAGREAPGLTPIDLDINLVKNLIESFSAQHGLPGPAGNLAGLLGVDWNSKMEHGATP